MHDQMVVSLALKNWTNEFIRFKKILQDISDDELLKEVAPGKNTGIYLLGHLISVADLLRPILMIGEVKFPELEVPFLRTPDKSGQEITKPEALREMFLKVFESLDQDLSKISTESWFERHNSVSEEDFLEEPHRNKLSVLSTRTIHQAYHAGQLALLIRK